MFGYFSASFVRSRGYSFRKNSTRSTQVQSCHAFVLNLYFRNFSPCSMYAILCGRSKSKLEIELSGQMDKNERRTELIRTVLKIA